MENNNQNDTTVVDNNVESTTVDNPNTNINTDTVNTTEIVEPIVEPIVIPVVTTNDEIIEEPIVPDYGVYTDIDEKIYESDNERFINTPKMDYMKYYNYSVSTNDIPQEAYNNNITLGIATLANINSANTMVSKTTFREHKYSDTVTGLTRNGETIAPRLINIATGTKKDRIKNKLNKITRSGSIIQLPCYNSGFQITLNIPNNNELYAIRKDIRDLAINTEINTGGFLFNNTKVAVVARILDFIFKYIVDSTLDMPDDDTNIYDYIVLEDYPLLIMGISYSLFPNGNTTTITCKNTTVMENNKPKCDYVANANLNVKDTLRIKDDRVTDNMFIILNKKNSGSVTMEEYTTYQRERLSFSNYDNTITFDNEGSSIVFTLGSNNINTYLKIAKLWVEDLEVKLYSLGDTHKDERALTLEELMDINKLGTYNTYISKVDVDGELISFDIADEVELKENLDVLNDILMEFSSDTVTLNIFFDKLFNYISYITIAGIAVNNFACPTCKKKQRDDINELIWLDPISYFLEILDYRFMNIVKNSEI